MTGSVSDLEKTCTSKQLVNALLRGRQKTTILKKQKGVLCCFYPYKLIEVEVLFFQVLMSYSFYPLIIKPMSYFSGSQVDCSSGVNSTTPLKNGLHTRFPIILHHFCFLCSSFDDSRNVLLGVINI